MVVSNILERHLIPSPPSTICLPLDVIQNTKSQEVQIALVRRILRFVSPRPWGSPAAESKGDHTSFNLAVKTLYHSHSLGQSFTCGSGVLWVPVSVRGNGRIRRGLPLPGTVPAWLAQREPPWDPKRLEKIGGDNPLVIDVTHLFLNRDSAESPTTVCTLYDCRFLITFDLDKVPQELLEVLRSPDGNAQLLLEPDAKFFLPTLTLRIPGRPDRTIAKLSGTERKDRSELVPEWVEFTTARIWQAV